MDKSIEKKLDIFFTQFRKTTIKNREEIIRAGEEVEYIYYLKKGFVRQYSTTKNGNEITHQIFKPISYFPIMLVLSNMDNLYTFEALEDLILWKAPKEKVLKFLQQNPDVLFDLATRFAQGLSKLLLKNETLLFTDAYTKVSSLLIYLAERFSSEEEGRIRITLPLTHTEIATWLGMQRETVSRQIEKLEKNNYIECKKDSIYIRDLNQLQQHTLGLNV